MRLSSRDRNGFRKNRDELGARKIQTNLFLKRIMLKKIRKEKLGTELSSSFARVSCRILEAECT